MQNSDYCTKVVALVVTADGVIHAEENASINIGAKGEHRRTLLEINVSEWASAFENNELQSVSMLYKSPTGVVRYALRNAVPDATGIIRYYVSALDTMQSGVASITLYAKGAHGQVAVSATVEVNIKNTGYAINDRDERLSAIAAMAQMVEIHFFAESLTDWIDKKDERNAFMDYFDYARGLGWKGYIKIKPQGTSSLAYPKKNFTVTTYADETRENKEKILINSDWGAQNKYCLKANWIDKTQACNVVSARIAAQMMEDYAVNADAPCHGLIDGTPALVYLNEDCTGLYTMNIPKDAWQFNMDKNNLNHIVLCAEDQLTEGAFKATATAVGWSIEVGEDTEENIFNKFNRMVSFVKDTEDMGVFKREFSQYLDLDACLNYYCFCYLTGATDNLGKNMLMTTKDGNVWSPSLYDMDSLFGIQWDGIRLLPYDAQCPGDYQCPDSLLWKKIENIFFDELYERYLLLRKGALSDSNILTNFKRFIEAIPQDLYEYDARRWLGTRKMRRTLEQTTEWAVKRGAYVDETLKKRYSILHGEPQLVYKLPEPFESVVANCQYVDTGLQLLAGGFDSFTLICRVNADVGDGTVMFAAFSERYPTPGYYGMMARAIVDKLELKITSETGYVGPLTENTPLPDTEWLDIAIVKNMDNYTQYVNGTMVASGTVTGLEAVTETLLIGAQHDSNGNPFRFGTMYIPYFEVYTGVMKKDEIQEKFNSI